MNTADESDEEPIFDELAPLQSPAQNPKTLAATPSHIIAGIAAQIQTPVLKPVERVRLAFELLDAAESGIQGLKKLGCHHTGLNEHLDAQIDFADEKAEADTLLHSPIIKNDVVDFDTAMSLLFSRGVAKKDRPERFARFVTIYYLSPEAELAKEEAVNRGDLMSVILGEHKTDSDAVLKKWMKEGVPADFFILAQKEFPDWWRAYVRDQRSRAGKMPKKPKQGRVRRKKDKRIGARL